MPEVWRQASQPRARRLAPTGSAQAQQSQGFAQARSEGRVEKAQGIGGLEEEGRKNGVTLILFCGNLVIWKMF